MSTSSHEPGGVTSDGRDAARTRGGVHPSSGERKAKLPELPRLLSNMGAHLGGLYGSKALDFVLLAVVARKLTMAEVGTYFLSMAAGAVVFRLVDLGLYPVLQRRAARGEASLDLLRWATRTRMGGVLVLSLAFALVARWRYPDDWLLATAFFVSSGTYQVHEIPRAILAGREQFRITARLGVATKALEVLVSAPCVWLGLGVWPWAIGRVVSQLVLLGVLYGGLRRQLPARGAPSPRAIVREGMPFWFTSLFQSAVFRVDTLVVGAYLGLAEAAHLGIASRLIGGALSVVNSLLIVTFPSLARERRRFITPREATVVVGLSLLLGACTFAAAPLAVRAVTGRWEAGPTDVTRTLVPVIVLTAISQALEAWLQAKNRERALAVLTVVTGILSAALLLVLVRTEGTLGAAFARDARALVEAAAVGFYTLAVLAAVRAPVAWGLAFVPLGRALVLRLVRRRRDALAQDLSRIPGVVSVELGGSARRGAEHAFRPGTSDLDLTVATRLPRAALPDTILRVESRLRRGAWLGPAQAMVVDADLLREARRLGHPILDAPHETLWGESHEPEPDARSLRHWALSHAIERFSQLQRAAADASRHDGGARTSEIAKELRHVLGHIHAARGGTARLAELEAQLPPGVLPGRGPDRLWLRPEEVGQVLSVASYALSVACEEAVAGWSVAPGTAPSCPAWLDEAGARCAPFVRAVRDLDVSVELAASSPVGERARLIVVDPGQGSAFWLPFLREASSPLSLPAGPDSRPVALPLTVLRAAAFIERTPLVYLGRRRAAVALTGSLSPVAEPDAAFLREAAGRELLHASVRIPTDLAWLRRGGRERGLSAFARARVETYLDGRLVALRLLADGATLPPDPREIASSYTARYGPSALALRLSGLPDPAPAALEAALLEWVDGVTPGATRSIVSPGANG